MIDIFDKLTELGQMDDTQVRSKYGTSTSRVKKVLKVLLLEQLQDDQKNSGKPKYGKRKGKSSDSEGEPQKVGSNPTETPDSRGSTKGGSSKKPPVQ